MKERDKLLNKCKNNYKKRKGKNKRDSKKGEE